MQFGHQISRFLIYFIQKHSTLLSHLEQIRNNHLSLLKHKNFTLLIFAILVSNIEHNEFISTNDERINKFIYKQTNKIFKFKTPNIKFQWKILINFFYYYKTGFMYLKNPLHGPSSRAESGRLNSGVNLF